MAGERIPKRKGGKDALLSELEGVLNGAAKGPAVPSESMVNLPQAAAETATPVTEAGKAEAIAPELEHLKPEERELYSKLPKDKQESYLAHIAEMRAEGEKKETKKEQRKPRKPKAPKAPPKAKPEKPKTLSIEERQKEMEEEIDARRADMAVAVPEDSPEEKEQAQRVALQKEIEEEIEARRADMNAAETSVAPTPIEEKPAEKTKEEGKEEEWSPSALEEQRSAVLGELYELYRRDASGPMEFGAIPDDVHQKFEKFFNERSKDLSPADTIPEADIEAFLTEQRAATGIGKIEVSEPENEAKIIPNPDDAIDPEHAWEMRRASEKERTLLEERSLLRKLIEKLTGQPMV